MKWRIKGTTGTTSFFDSARIIINKRLKDLIISIKDYFADESVENLHQVRIALRRLRYTLEVFYCCFEKKLFNVFYNQIESLQDLSGKVRDLDVLKSNLKLYALENSEAVPEMIVSIDENKVHLNEELKLNLMKFIHGKELKIFKNQIKKRR